LVNEEQVKNDEADVVNTNDDVSEWELLPLDDLDV
jgi:hypothetical protein